MKIVGLVLDQECRPVAFKMEGRAAEFGGLGNQIVTNVITMVEVISTKFKNNQLDCSNGVIREVGKFRKSELPTEMFLENNKYVPFDNTINLTARLLENGKLAGFKVVIGGTLEKNYRSTDIIKLSSWFKCGNFMIQSRKNDTGEVAKVYISGKPGHAVSDLPEIELGVGDKATKKAKTRSVTDASVKATPTFDPLKFDIVSLFETVENLNGYVVKLPNTKYNLTHRAETVTGKGFIELGIGEVANPYLDYSEKSMAVNVDFRKIGNVTVNYNGAKLPLPTYVVKKKSLFVNGKNNIKKFGIVVGADQVNQLKAAFGGSLAIELVKSDKMVTPIRSMYGDNSLQMFTVDTSNLDIISKHKVNNYMLNQEQILKNCLRIVELKTAIRYVNYVKNNAKVVMAESGIADPRPKYGMYAGFSEDLLKALTEAGIDVYSGLYTVKEEADNTKEDAKSVQDMIKDGTVVKEEARFEVEYGVAGFKSIPSANDIANKTNKASKYLTKFVTDIIDEFEAMNNTKQMFETADAYSKKLNKEKDKYVKELWLHKMACLSAGNYEGFKDNLGSWAPGKPNKNLVVHDYVATKPGCELLTIKLTNLDLK